MRPSTEISSVTQTGQTWDTTAYAANGRFVANLATVVVTLLNPQPGEAIFDIGCGDAALTEQLAAAGAILTAIETCIAMVVAARIRSQSSPNPFIIEQIPAELLDIDRWMRPASISHRHGTPFLKHR